PYPAAFDGITRRYYLPAGLPLGRYWKDGQVIDVPAPEEKPEGPDVPKYTAPGRSEPFVYVKWPTAGMKAASDAAAQIIAWMAANSEHPDVDQVPSPFNLFDMKPWLPRLPEQKSAHPPPPTFTYERSRGHVVKQADGSTKIVTIDGGFS